MVRRVMVVVALVTGAMIAGPTAVAGASPAALTCPDGNVAMVVSADAVLTHDLSCSGELVEWDFAPGVTVDLGGHRVIVDSHERCSVGIPGCTFEVGSGTLRNGRLEGADVNVGDGHASRLGVRNGLAEVTRSGELTRSVIDGGQVVIERGGHLTHSWVIRGKGVLLLNIDHSLTDFEVSNNLIVGNTGNGIQLGTHFYFANDVTGTIAHNFVARNTANGISIGGDLRDLGAVQITQNLVAANAGTGIVVNGSLEVPGPTITGGPVTLTKNVSVFNAGHGIDASWMPAWTKR